MFPVGPFPVSETEVFGQQTGPHGLWTVISLSGQFKSRVSESVPSAAESFCSNAHVEQMFCKIEEEDEAELAPSMHCR